MHAGVVKVNPLAEIVGPEQRAWARVRITTMWCLPRAKRKGNVGESDLVIIEALLWGG